ncbi:unnamed protein product [Rhizoctonia solani]|uniref:Peptidase C14 caspase domain-containing protein n=1 Tax=Rhizoctonia solani TaxID=456999 RepID=A0A8H3D1I8_9AGAM|nr:unnamed protein product [Rhizoctonia solani]
MVAINPGHEHAQFAPITKQIKRQAPFPTLHALLIGIDKYKRFAKLSGAVKDVESVYEFLHSDLSVPESQITQLRNEQATRFGIINAMEQLSKNRSIKRFDPILIFYAGHGCEVDSPLANYEEKAQCLVPWDIGDQETDGQTVSPIPDYTIAALLNELAMEKGNNITVIFDSCHSASGTRGIRGGSANAEPKLSIQFSQWQNATSRHSVVDPGVILAANCRARSLNSQDLPPLTLDTDKRIIRRAQRRRRWRTIIAFVRSHVLFMHITTRTEPSGIRAQPRLKRVLPDLLRFSCSHVLLAACGHAEQAYECTECNCGYFTAVLLQMLRSSYLHNLKYKRCFEEFPKLNTPSPQSPVCEGDTNGRVFFTIPAPALPTRSASFTMLQSNEGYLMKLGDAQGVFPGSKYGIYEDLAFSIRLASGDSPSPGMDRPLWGSFKAYPYTDSYWTHYPFYSWCQLGKNAKLPCLLRAKLLKLGRRGTYSLKVFVSEELRLSLDPNSIVRVNQGTVLVDSVDQGDTSTVLLDIEHGHITFRLSGFSGVLYRCDSDAKRVRRILRSMAQWRWHLSREPQHTLKHKITVELTMHELGDSGLSPLPVDEDKAITVKASETVLYALKVKSLFPRQLYAYLFYFSTTSQSIRPLYLGVYGSHHIDPSLQPHGELTIGYNNDDMIPDALSFSMTPDEGYFRLFLTTSPGDFDSMVQPSPFAVPQTWDTMATGDYDEHGDGLEIRRYSPTNSGETEPVVLHPTPSGSSGEHVLEIEGSEQQQGYTAMRMTLPENVARGLLPERAQWGVVNLKVKCR